MKITIATLGSRGDVQPYLALGRGLQKAGHQVRMAVDKTFKPLVQESGLTLSPVNADPRKALQEDIRQIGSNPVRLMRWIKRHFNPLAHQYFLDIQAACRDSEALIFSNLAFASYHVSEAMNIPALAAFLQPSTPTRVFASTTGPAMPGWLPFRGRLNWLSFRLASWMLFGLTKGTINQCRREILGLPPVSWRVLASLDVSDYPIVYGYSRHVVPKPADWGDWLHVTGYWFLDSRQEWEPPPSLRSFLDAGPPPVYIGFGSMVDREADILTSLVAKAIDLTGRRAVLLGGWSDLGAAGLPDARTDQILRIKNVPHDWLFPRMAAVVHHGGAGTTAAGLRAGVPAVVVPFFADQPFWGRQINKLGVGPAPIPRKKLTTDRLAQAIEQATADPEMKARAAELGAKIRAENGVAEAVTLIEHYLGEGVIQGNRRKEP